MGGRLPRTKAIKLDAAACQGLVNSSYSMPYFSSTKAFSGFFKKALLTNSCAEVSHSPFEDKQHREISLQPRYPYPKVIALELPAASSCVFLSRSETYSPPAIEKAPAKMAAKPERKIIQILLVALATPITTPAME